MDIDTILDDASENKTEVQVLKSLILKGWITSEGELAKDLMLLLKEAEELAFGNPLSTLLTENDNKAVKVTVSKEQFYDILWGDLVQA